MRRRSFMSLIRFAALLPLAKVADKADVQKKQTSSVTSSVYDFGKGVRGLDVEAHEKIILIGPVSRES